MNENTGQSEVARVERTERWRKKSASILTLLFVIVVTIVLFLYRDKVADLGNYGYLGVFLISLISSSTIILPMPGMLLIFALGATFNPVIVGLIAAFGGTLGEITGYMLGYSGRKILLGDKMYIRAERWLKKWGILTVFIFALVPPLAVDIVGIVAGTLRFPLWKFLLACLLGKILLYTAMAFAGGWGWDAILKYFW